MSQWNKMHRQRKQLQKAYVFVDAEILPVDIADCSCFKTAKGRLHGSYIRIGDADKSMTEYEEYRRGVQSIYRILQQIE